MGELRLSMEDVVGWLRQDRAAEGPRRRARAAREGRPLTVEDFPDVTVGEVHRLLLDGERD